MKKIKLDFFKNRNNLIVLILIGVLLVIISLPTGQKKKASAVDTAAVVSSESTTLEAYVSQQETRLEKILSKIQGAGQVRVMITAKASKELVVEKDLTTKNSSSAESSGDGNKIQEEVTTEESTLYNSGANPYVVKELEPVIQGVVVAAQGGGDSVIVDDITYAIQVLYDLPVHKIKVVKLNSKDTGS